MNPEQFMYKIKNIYVTEEKKLDKMKYSLKRDLQEKEGSFREAIVSARNLLFRLESVFELPYQEPTGEGPRPGTRICWQVDSSNRGI